MNLTYPVEAVTLQAGSIGRRASAFFVARLTSMLVLSGLAGMVAISVAILLTTSLVLRASVDGRAFERLDKNMLVAERLLQDAGPIRLDGDKMYAGSVLLNGNGKIVDDLARMLGGAASIFCRDVRITTSINASGHRAIGTRLARGPAWQAVFVERRSYRGPVRILGVDYYGAYDPIPGADGHIIGALFTGMTKARFRSSVVAAQTNIVLISTALILLVALLFNAAARRLKRMTDRQNQRFVSINTQLEVAFENMTQGLCFFDHQQRLITSNACYARMYNIAPSQVVPGMHLDEMIALRIAAGTGPAAYTQASYIERHHRINGTREPSEELVELVDGRTFLLRNNPLGDGGSVATHTDVTARCRDEARVRFLARHDPLTGLKNRLAFRDDLAARIAGSGSPFAVLSLDLDRFKEVNDNFGHVVGDELLRQVAARLVICIGDADADAAARLGGDEFALVSSCISDKAAIEALGAAIVRSLEAPFLIDSLTIRIGAAIGALLVDTGQTNIDGILLHTDLALYEAKAHGSGCTMFHQGLLEAYEGRRSLRLELLDAIGNGQLVLHYQPQHDVMTGHLIGFEALVRWQHPRRGLLSPAMFIEIAEESGLILQLGRWVLERACADAARWMGLKVAVNVSAVQFRNPTLCQEVIGAARAAGLRPELLVIEVTESILVESTAEVAATLSLIRGAGVGVALDDFGTGYSSLSYLRSLTFDCIKIDRSFVKDLEAVPDAAAVVSTIIQLARTFHATTVAEGVETLEQLTCLRELGCDVAQGYHFSRPVPVNEADVMAQSATRLVPALPFQRALAG